LIELMVVVTILSFLFLLAVPTYQRLQRKAKTAALVNDFRTFATAFQTHAHDAGSWPPEAAAGVVPTGMTPEELKYDDWTHTTPMGGKFDWEYNQIHGGVQSRAAITITPTSDAPLVIDSALLLDIDRAIDDGDLATGNFRTGFGGRPLFVIEN
jgi:type II secretory pathway pseudopilin PulG